MKKFGIILFFVGALLTACENKNQTTAKSKESAEVQTPSESPKPQTIKTEAFSARKGIVLIKGFTSIGTVKSKDAGRVSVETVELRDASNPKSQELGIKIDVLGFSQGMGRVADSISFIDYDEIDSLIKGLDYIAKIDKSVTTMSDFEVTYKTKSDFSISVFNDSKGKLSSVVSSGNRTANVYLSLDELEKIKSLFVKAKQSLDTLKNGSPK